MPEKVLFIGHSLVGYMMPEMLSSFMGTLGLDVDVDKQVINGSPLRWNWDNGDWAEGVNARNVLPSGEYTAVVITEALPLDDQLLWNDTHGYAQRYYDLALSANAATQFYIFETWHNIGADTAAWRAQIETDLPKWEGIADYINANAQDGANPALVVPAGQAMARLYDAIEADEIPGLTSISDVFEDTIHLNELGNWFMATLQAATVLGIDPASVPAQTIGSYGIAYDAPNAALASALSTVIDQTLADYARDGRDSDATPPIGGGNAPDTGDTTDGVDEDDDAPDGDLGNVGGDDAPDVTGDDAPDVTGDGDIPTQPDTPASDPTDQTPAEPPLGDSVTPVDVLPADEAPTFEGPHVGGEIAFGLGFGLSSVADYVSNTPFLNIFKTSRDFIGHEPGRWGGVDHAELEASGVFDENGWPVTIPDGVDYIGTLILTDLPTEMTQAAGRYRVTWEGEGEVRVGLSAYDVVLGENEAWFSYAPSGGGTVSVEIHRTDPQDTGDYVRDIFVVKQEHIAAFEAGEIFNPYWIDVIEDAHSLRFMDWMETNNSQISTYDDAPRVSDASWGIDGVPLEIMVRLANETHTDPWFTLPHLADEAYMRSFVTEVRDTLDPGLKAYFEFSNEVWNFQFDQSYHSHLEGQARFPGEGTAWVQNYAADAVTMACIIDEVYGENSPDSIKVIATQTGWMGLEGAILDAPAWVAENPSQNAAPATYFDAYAVTGYFDGGLGRGDKPFTVKNWLAQSLMLAEDQADALGLTGVARIEHVANHRYDYATALAAQELRDGSVTGDAGGSLADLQTQFSYHKSIADARGLELVMYEGGTHVVGVGEWLNDAELTDFFTHLNYTAEMGTLYGELLELWKDEGGTLFNAFTAVGSPSQFGSWGHLRYLGDQNARMDAVDAFFAEYPKVQTIPPTSDDVPTSDTPQDDPQMPQSPEEPVAEEAPVETPIGPVPPVAPTPNPEDPPNGPVQGTITILGIAEQGQTLVADVSTIVGVDGIEADTFEFEWLRDGISILGAKGDSYDLRQSDVGSEVSVRLHFVDQQGAVETFYSVETSIIDNTNDAPTGAPSIQGVLQKGAELSANLAFIQDLDGIDWTTVEVRWLRDGVEIPAANGTSYVLQQPDVGAAISLVVEFNDAFGIGEQLVSQATDPIAGINHAVDGRPIVVGTLLQGETVSVDVSDVFDLDGIIPHSEGYQWLRNGTEITGETSRSMVLTEQDVGTYITVKYSFEDSNGHTEVATALEAQSISNKDDDHTGLVTLQGRGDIGSFIFGDASTVRDPDGINEWSTHWTWIRTNELEQSRTFIDGAKDAQYRLTELDQGHIISAKYSYTDDYGTFSSAVSAGIAVNASPTGSVLLVGSALQGNALTADLSSLQDEDGIIRGTISYEWFVNGVARETSTPASLHLSSIPIGAVIKVKVTYEDQAGFSQSVLSDDVTVEPVEITLQSIRTGSIKPEDDILIGGDGDDLLHAGEGLDFLDGGNGIDTAVLQGHQSSYTVLLTQAGTLLMDRSAEIVDRSQATEIRSIELLDFEQEIDLFSDGPLSFDLFSDAGKVGMADIKAIAELYVAYVNRAPDAIGLTYWASQFANGFDLHSIAKSFFTQPEAKLAYGDMLSADGSTLEDTLGFVTAVYANVLGREPDPTGLAYWMNELNEKPDASPATFILTLLRGAQFPSDPTEQTALDQLYIDAKTNIGTYFSAAKGLSDVSEAATVMSLFDGTSEGLQRAVAQVDAFYTEALDGSNGEFLMQLMGVADTPFNELF